jgi:hypothetical protein
VRREAPVIRDSMLNSFGFSPATLKDVASPEALDRITTNALGLRLGDPALAADVYRDVRNQVIRAPERWHDVNVSVDLAPLTTEPATGAGSMLVATVRWQYRVRLASETIRFARVGDLTEYRELMRDP